MNDKKKEIDDNTTYKTIDILIFWIERILT